MFSGNDILSANIQNIDYNVIACENKNERLGIVLDSKKSWPRLRNKVMNAIVSSEFGYYPIVWMSRSRILSNKINFLNERALRITRNTVMIIFTVRSVEKHSCPSEEYKKPSE